MTCAVKANNDMRGKGKWRKQHQPHGRVAFQPNAASRSFRRDRDEQNSRLP